MRRYLKLARRLPRLVRAALLATAASGGSRAAWALWAMVGLAVVSFAADVILDLTAEAQS